MADRAGNKTGRRTAVANSKRRATRKKRIRETTRQQSRRRRRKKRATNKRPRHTHCVKCGRQLATPERNKTGYCYDCFDRSPSNRVADPTPSEIAERCAAIRAEWSHLDWERRATNAVKTRQDVDFEREYRVLLPE